MIKMLQYFKILICPNRIFVEWSNSGVRALVKDKLKSKGLMWIHLVSQIEAKLFALIMATSVFLPYLN